VLFPSSKHHLHAECRGIRPGKGVSYTERKRSMVVAVDQDHAGYDYAVIWLAGFDQEAASRQGTMLPSLSKCLWL